MIDQTQRIAICHLLLRGTRWMPVSVNRKLGPNDRCAPGGAVISAVLCASWREMQSLDGRKAPDSWLEKSERMVLQLRSISRLRLWHWTHGTSMRARPQQERLVSVRCSQNAAFRDKKPAIFLQNYAKPHSSALKYRYSTNFKVTLQWEFCFSTNVRDQGDEQGSASAARS